jgi:hypothetical protein
VRTDRDRQNIFEIQRSSIRLAPHTKFKNINSNTEFLNPLIISNRTQRVEALKSLGSNRAVYILLLDTSSNNSISKEATASIELDFVELQFCVLFLELISSRRMFKFMYLGSSKRMYYSCGGRVRSMCPLWPGFLKLIYKEWGRGSGRGIVKNGRCGTSVVPPNNPKQRKYVILDGNSCIKWASM